MSNMVPQRQQSHRSTGYSIRERRLEENDISGVEKMKEQVRGWNRKLEDIRMQLVDMRVETSLPWGSDYFKEEKEVCEELDLLKKEVEKAD